MAAVITLKENPTFNKTVILTAVVGMVIEMIFGIIISIQRDNQNFLDDSLWNVRSLLMLCDFITDNSEHLSLRVFDDTVINGLHLFDINDFNSSNSDLTDEAKAKLDEKYPNGFPEVSLKYIETEDRNAQPTLTIDTETDSVVFTAPINYRMFLNEDSVFSIWI